MGVRAAPNGIYALGCFMSTARLISAELYVSLRPSQTIVVANLLMAIILKHYIKEGVFSTDL